DGQLPDHARQRAGGRPRDVRRARPERGAPARQRRQPPPGQPLGLAGGRDSGRGRGSAGRRSRTRAGGPRRAAVGCLDPASLSRQTLCAAPPGRGPKPRAGRLADSAMSEIEARLQELERLGLGRRLRLISGPQGPTVLLEGKPVLLLCSNNYLGLADHPRVREAAADAAMRWGVGAGASRLVSGTMTIHGRLEERLAAFKGSEACVLFGSGYLANLGVIGALAGSGDAIFSDELNHASIVDGCRLSRAEVIVYRHRDVEHLEWSLRRHGGGRDGEGRRLIVTDSVFSMDGDVAPLAQLADVADAYDARLVVDEAHALGNLGPDGRGAVAAGGLAGARGRRGDRPPGQGARLLWLLRVRERRDGPLPDQHGEFAYLLDGSLPAR